MKCGTSVICQLVQISPEEPKDKPKRSWYRSFSARLQIDYTIIAWNESSDTPLNGARESRNLDSHDGVVSKAVLAVNEIDNIFQLRELAWTGTYMNGKSCFSATNYG